MTAVGLDKVADRDIIATMVKSYSSPSSDTAAPLNPDAMQVLGMPPSEDELVAIAAAVDAYIAIDAQLHMSLPKTDKSLSPWLVAARLQAAKSLPGGSSPGGSPSGRTTSGGGGKSLWGSLFSLALIASSLAIGVAPQALAQGRSVSASTAASASSNAFYGTWNYKDQAQTVRVLLGVPTSKVDLDLPDGGSIYSTDGTLVAKVGPRSSWTLNLASARSRGGYNIASTYGQALRRFIFAGKSSQDTATTHNLPQGGNIQNTSYAPSAGYAINGAGAGGGLGENRFALTGEDGYLVIPDARSSEGAVPLVGINGKLYRGSLLLRPSITTTGGTNGQAAAATNTLIAVINIVKIEDYLLSVVPSEVPASWHPEVLKAQAIAARSYVVANLGKHKADGYDVKDSVEDQVYKGVASENDETNVACANTTGLVLKQNAQVISAFFHSTSGGGTELAENVWSKPLPYLKSVVDYDDASPHFNWQRSFTVDQLSKLLAVTSSDSSKNISTGAGTATPEQLSALFVVGRHATGSQRVKHMIAIGTSSGRMLTGTEVRKLLNLPSTQFSVYSADGAYIFSGHGNGHGLGLSQWGAKALADKGYNAGQILSYYYKDVTIESMGEQTGPNGSI